MSSTRSQRYAFCLLSAFVCAACETSPNHQTADEKEATQYVRTGSRIPVKDPDSSYSKSVDVQSVKDSMQTSGARTVRPPGQ